MSDGKKKRMSMLDALANPASASANPIQASNRALRSARDAVDGHRVWELDPDQIEDLRVADRLDPDDVADLRASIETNGQSVPILVRRHPTLPDRYLLVYGRRRLEAVRSSARVEKIRALIASLDEDAALRAQISENTGRRDLSFIERALFAQELVNASFGTQAQIAEVLNVTKSSISMALSIARTVGLDLATAIGPAHGVGRPRWEALSRGLVDSNADLPALQALARAQREKTADTEDLDPSMAAFEAVEQAVTKQLAKMNGTNAVKRPAPHRFAVNDHIKGRLKSSNDKLSLELTGVEDAFSHWFEQEAESLMKELHARWQQQAEKKQ